MFFLSNFYWGFSAIDTLVNDAFAQLMVLLEKRLRMLILTIGQFFGLSIGGVFFSVKIQCVTKVNRILLIENLIEI